ncbi:MAG: HAMP domain-containing sensor histidine kinase [Acidimicrobiales bacterium]
MLTLIVALTVGWFAVAMSSKAQYATLDSSIDAVVSSGLRNPNTALSNALYVLQRNNYDLTLDVVFPGGEISQVNGPPDVMRAQPTVANVQESLKRVVQPGNLPGYRIRSLNVGGGDYLVVAGSTAGIAKQNQHLALLVAGFAFVITLLGLVLARAVMRRDLRTMEHLIDYAADVAGGGDVGEMPASEGSRDLQELRGALVVMVDALKERIEFEAKNTDAMQQFIDDASHELRTPLTVVKGYNELLASGSASPDVQARAVSRVRREVERMEELVRDLLLLAELREAPLHAAERINLSALVKSRVEEFGSEHPERWVTFDVTAGLSIEARPDFAERLLNNALTNIVRYTPSNAPVRVTLRRSGGDATLLIEDGGPGLPEYGVRPQRFQRYDDSRSRETGGSGLGMSIMADVAESLGGSMSTEKSSLGGLALRFVVPLVVAESS